MKELFLSLLLAFGAFAAQAQEELAEAAYLKADSLLWGEYDRTSRQLFDEIEAHPERRDSLMAVYEELHRVSLERNCELALRYAATPSGLQRLYMVRLDLPKERLASVLDSLPAAMRRSPYAESIRRHIEARQIAEGDRLLPFEAVTERGEAFDWKSLEGRRVLLLYGGLGCMGEWGRGYVASLSERLPAGEFVVVVYWPAATPEELHEIREAFPGDYLLISDFRKDHSPMKILYGAQATPTCFLADSDGTVRVKSVGLNPGRFDELLFGEDR